MSLRPRAIGTKLFWAIGVPGLVVALIGAGLFWREADDAVSEESRREALAISELLSSSFALAAAAPNPPAEGTPPQMAHRAVTELVRADWRLFQHLKSLRVVGADGTIRWSRRVEEEGTSVTATPSRVSGAESIAVEADRVEVTRVLGGMECGGCHVANAMSVGALTVRVEQPELRARVASLFGRALTSVLLLFALLLGVMAVSLHFLLNLPLHRLARVMRRAEEGDFLVRAEVRSRDEIGALAEAFNRMLARITSLTAQEIDTHRDLEAAHEQLSLKQALEETNHTLEKRVNEQALLFDVARSLSSTLEMDELFARISALIGERLKIPQFSIMLLEGERLVIKSAWPRGQGTEGLGFALGQGACGQAASTQKPVYLADLQTQPGPWVPRPGQSTAQGSLLVVPMLHKSALLGVINFERPTPNAFSPQEIALLSAVADLAAIASKNALLHEETVALSITDPLTGIANRRHLFSRLELEIARAARYQSPLSVLMVDIDSFKHLNDVQGHRAGDEVLKRVCDLLQAAIRKVDTLARYGGEEFLLILPEVGKSEALDVAEKLRRTIDETIFPEGAQQPLGKVTISVGAASLHVDARGLEQLVDCADAALYASKRGGRNKATAFEPGMEDHPGRERGPQAARRKRTGEQPVVSLPTRTTG